jgi:tetratricopeptide (TPR) repeat protein
LRATRTRERDRGIGARAATAALPVQSSLPGLAATLLLALAVKAVVLAQLHLHPLLQPRGEMDDAVFVRLAQRAAAGDWALGPDVYFLSPAYTYFLAVIFALSGGSTLAARAVQILLGTAAVGLVFATARLWSGPRAAHAAAVFAALTGLFTFNEVLLLQSSLDPFLTALALFLLSRALGAARALDFVPAGLALGLLAMNRPNALPCAAVAVLGIAAVRRSRAGRRQAAALAAGIALAIAPVAIRNRLVAGEWVLLTSHGGLNFYIGNNADADGTYRRLPGITPSIEGQARDAKRVAEAALGRPLAASEVSGYFYGRAASWMAQSPGAAARLFARKVGLVLSDIDLSLNYSFAYYSRDERTLLRFLVVGPWLLVPLGLLGIVVGAPRYERGAYAVFASFAPVYALSVAAFFVAGRYRLPLLVALCVTSGVALAWLEQRRGRRQLAPLGAAAAVLVALAVLARRDTGFDEGRMAERTEMALHLIDDGRGREAKDVLARPIDADARALVFAWRRAGRAFAERGQASDVIFCLEKALAAGDESAAVDLAEVRAGLGDADAEVAAIRRVAPAGLEAATALELGGRALELRDPALALPLLERAARADPRSPEAREKLGLALGMLGRRAEGIAALDEAGRLDPRSARARLNRAVMLAQEGRYTEARASAVEALRILPDYAQARALLAELDRLDPRGRRE